MFTAGEENREMNKGQENILSPYIFFQCLNFFFGKFFSFFFFSKTKLGQEVNKLCLWCFPLILVPVACQPFPPEVHEPTPQTPGSLTCIQHSKLSCYHQPLQVSCPISQRPPIPKPQMSAINQQTDTLGGFGGRKLESCLRFHVDISSRVSCKQCP